MNRTLALLFIILLTACGGQVKDKSAGNENTGPESGQTVPGIAVLFHKAALDGDITAVRQVLSGSLNIDTLDEDGRTALMYAAFNGHTDIAKILIEKGADINLTDPNKRTALMFASSGPFPETVRILLEHNADPDLTDMPEHFTALMYAAAEGHLNNVRILLTHKANPKLKDIDGDDAATFASNNNHEEIADLIKSFL
jgi:ankyrin repeat protein